MMVYKLNFAWVLNIHHRMVAARYNLTSASILTTPLKIQVMAVESVFSPCSEKATNNS